VNLHRPHMCVVGVHASLGGPPARAKRPVAPSTCLPANRLRRPACNLAGCRKNRGGGIPDLLDIGRRPWRGAAWKPCASSKGESHAKPLRRARQAPARRHGGASPRGRRPGSRGADALRRAEPCSAAAQRWAGGTRGARALRRDLTLDHNCCRRCPVRARALAAWRLEDQWVRRSA